MNEHRLIAVHKESGVLLDIDEVSSGLNKEHVCASCGDALVAKKGAVNRWHFAHRATGNQSCNPNGESLIHQFAKKAIQQGKRIPLPLSASRLFFQPMGVEKEFWIPNHKVDAVAFGSFYYPHSTGWKEEPCIHTSTGVGDEHMDFNGDTYEDMNKVTCPFEPSFDDEDYFCEYTHQPLLIEFFHTNQKKKYKYLKGFIHRPTYMMAIEINVSHKEIQSAKELTGKTNIRELIEFLIYRTPNHFPNHHKRWLAFEQDHIEFERPPKQEMDRELQIWEYPEHRICGCGEWFKSKGKYSMCYNCYKQRIAIGREGEQKPFNTGIQTVDACPF